MKTAICFFLFNMTMVLSGIAQPERYSFKEDFSISTPATLKISAHDGYIHAEPKSGNSVDVYFVVKKQGRLMDISRSELEEEVEITIDHSASHLDIKIKQKESISGWLNKERYDVSVEIHAPQRSTCELYSSDGDIRIEGFDGNQKCKTSDGDILTSAIRGDIELRTSDGDIDISDIRGQVFGQTSDGDIKVVSIGGSTELITSDGHITAESINGNSKFRTSDGSIYLSKLTGNVQAKTSDSNITFVDLSGSLTAHTSDGHVKGNMRRLEGDLIASTSDGNIQVTIPGGLGMDLRLKGENIRTELDDFSGRSTDKSIDGQVRGGGVLIQLSTSDGSVVLDYQ